MVQFAVQVIFLSLSELFYGVSFILVFIFAVHVADVAVFFDTGREPSTLNAYLSQYTNKNKHAYMSQSI